MKFPTLISLMLLYPILVIGQNSTTTGALVLYQTFETIGYRASYTNDGNVNMTAVVEYRQGAGAWSTVASSSTSPPIYIDRRVNINDGGNSVANPDIRQARGKIFELERNTTYDVRITYIDGDGVIGTNPVLTTVTTWSHDVESNSGTTHSVDSDATLGIALGIASGGDIISLRASTIYSGLTISSSGSSGNPIKIVSADSDNKGVFTGQVTVTGDWLFFDDVQFNALIKLQAAQWNVFKDTLHNDDGIHIDSGDNVGLLIDGATISLGTTFATPNTDTGVYIDPGISSPNPTRIVVRNSTITGGRDAVGGAANKNYSAGYSESDFYGNNFSGQFDDAFELEGNNINVAAWANTVGAGSVGGPGGGIPFACAPVVSGPLYWINNFASNVTSFTAFKLGAPGGGDGADGRMFILNNTIIDANNVLIDSGGGGGGKNVYARNNIFQSDSNSGNDIVEHNSYTSTWDFDYDNSWAISGLSWQWDGSTYTTLNSFQSLTGNEINGFSVDPDISINGVPNSDSSPIVDVAVTLDAFTKDHAGITRGAQWDIGAFEFVFSFELPIDLPEFSPIGGTYTETQNVSITTQTNGTSIYFTLDGTTPDNTDMLFVSPFVLSVDTTVKSIAQKVGHTDSLIATAIYDITIPPPATPPSAPTALLIP